MKRPTTQWYAAYYKAIRVDGMTDKALLAKLGSELDSDSSAMAIEKIELAVEKVERA